MNTEENSDRVILQSFQAFVVEQQLVSQSDIEELLDETISAYVINTIKQFYSEYENHKLWLDEVSSVASIDLSSFIEIIDAYVCGFSAIQSDSIIEWLIKLKKQTSTKNPCVKSIQVDSNETKLSPNKKQDVGKGCEKPVPKVEVDPNLALLFDMFPELDKKEIEKVYIKCDRNHEKSIDELLSRHNIIYLDEKDDLTEEEKRALKEKTLERFADVPVKLGDDGKTMLASKPVFKWNAEKKLVRYYENKVVSTKGERYFEYKTEEEEEMAKQMKKTYINLKPARKYRFH